MLIFRLRLLMRMVLTQQLKRQNLIIVIFSTVTIYGRSKLFNHAQCNIRHMHRLSMIDRNEQAGFAGCVNHQNLLVFPV